MYVKYHAVLIVTPCGPFCGTEWLESNNNLGTEISAEVLTKIARK
jgi:hypothetical protein